MDYELLFAIVDSVIACLYVSVFTDLFLEKRISKKNNRIVLVVMISCIILASVLFDLNMYITLVNVVLLYIMLVHKEKFLHKLFVACVYMVMGFLFEVLVPFTYAVISGGTYAELNDNGVEFFSVLLTIVDVLLLSIYLFLINKKLVPKNFKLVNYKNTTMLIMIVILTIVFIFIAEINTLIAKLGTLTFDIPTFFFFFTFLLAASVFIGILFITQKNIKEQLLSSDNKMLELQLSSQLEHYNQLEKGLTDTRKIKHDMQNHIIALRYLLDKKMFQDANSYLDDLDTKINSLASAVETGNNIFDAIYIEKKEVAKSKAIEMEFSGVICKSNFIEPIDLCTIVSNSIDNAIEACSLLNEDTNKKITIESKMRKNYWIYTISNTSIRVDIFNNTVRTTKNDVINHGFGLSNIKDSVEKYNGAIDIRNENNEFVLQVMLEKRT